jgi:peptide chain release factor 1
MKINKKIFKIDITKGTGAGGQHKNKVETCVTITHIPSGEKETCQETRYKNKNIEIAYDRLVSRLEEIESAKQHAERNDNRVKAIEENGVIRTYDYKRNLVKDHKTGKTANLKKFLNGELDLLN